MITKGLRMIRHVYLELQRTPRSRLGDGIPKNGRCRGLEDRRGNANANRLVTTCNNAWL